MRLGEANGLFKRVRVAPARRAGVMRMVVTVRGINHQEAECSRGAKEGQPKGVDYSPEPS